MKVKDFMTSPPLTCTVDNTVKEAARIMWERKISALPITNKSGDLVGIVTESNFVGEDVDIPHALGSIKGLLGEFYMQDASYEQIYTEARKKKLSQVMTKNVTVVNPETTLSEVGNLMTRKKIKRIPVVDSGSLIGIVTRKDLLNAFLNT